MDLSEVLISEDEIKDMVKRVASAIDRDYEGEDLVVIGVLTGAFIFVSDLVREMNTHAIVDFMQVSSYVGTESTGEINIKKDISIDIKGKNVLVVEDIIDTGRTLKALKAKLLERGPKSLKICTAFDKPSRRVNDLKPDYNGITIPDQFIVGYGLDYDGAFRDFKEIRIVR